MNLGTIYLYVALGTLGVNTVIYTVMFLSQLIYSAYRFVNDTKNGESILVRKLGFLKRLLFLESRDDPADFYLKLTLAWLIGLIIAFTWGAGAPAAIIYGSLLLLRWMIRFTKKVNTALETKADKGHSH